MSFLDKSLNSIPFCPTTLYLSRTISCDTGSVYPLLHIDPPTPRNSPPSSTPTFSLAPLSPVTSDLVRVLSSSSQQIQEAGNSAACLNSKKVALSKPEESNTKKKVGRPPIRNIKNKYNGITKPQVKTENTKPKLNFSNKKGALYVTPPPLNNKKTTIPSDMAFLEDNREWIVEHISNENILTLDCLMQCFREEGAQVQIKSVNEYLARIGLPLPTAREYKILQLEQHRIAINSIRQSNKFKYIPDLLLELSKSGICTDIDSLEEFLSRMRKRKTR